jgi:hypothetical protein
MTTEPTGAPLEMPLGQLERALIEEYLRARGHDPATLDALPEAERARLLTDASLYASAKLAEIESRSYLVQQLHEGGAGAREGGGGE